MSFSLTNMWLAFVALTPIIYPQSKPAPRSLHSSERISAGENPVKVWMSTRNHVTPETLALRMQLNGSAHITAQDIERMAVTPVSDMPVNDIVAFCRVMQITPERMVCYKRKNPAPGNVIEACAPFLYDQGCAHFVRGEQSRVRFLHTAHGHSATNHHIYDAVNALSRAIGQGAKHNLGSAAAYLDDIERRLDAIDHHLSGSHAMNGLWYSRHEQAQGAKATPYFAVENYRLVVEIPTPDTYIRVTGVNVAWLSAFRAWRTHPKTSAFLKAEANAQAISGNAQMMRQLNLYAPTALRAA